MSGLQSRLSDFKSRFSQLLGGRHEGYEELSGLERPLVAGDEDEEYDRSQRTDAAYRPPAVPATGAPAPGGGSFTAGHGPSQTDEIKELTVLSKDAAQILWEMVALGETGPAYQEMRGNAEQLRAQLRGLIGDYAGGDEAAFAAAFEAFDMISRCLDGEAADEIAAAAVQEAPPATNAPPPPPPPPAAALAVAAIPMAAAEPAAVPAVAAPVIAEEPPLISFD